MRLIGLCVALAFAAVLIAPPAAIPAFAASPEVIDSEPADGSVDAPCTGRYWIQFQNNVAAVPGNADLVTLETAEGETVGADRCAVTLPDVELEFAYRQYVWIDVKDLDPNAGYVISVAPGIAAKNGTVNDAGARIAFTTAASADQERALAEPEAVERGSGGGSGNGDGSGGQEAGSVASVGADDVDVDSSGAAADDAANTSSSGNQATESAPRADSASPSDAESDDQAPVVYVDAKGRPVVEPEEHGDPMPEGEVVLFGVCGITLALFLGITAGRARANAAAQRK